PNNYIKSRQKYYHQTQIQNLIITLNVLLFNNEKDKITMDFIFFWYYLYDLIIGITSFNRSTSYVGVTSTSGRVRWLIHMESIPRRTAPKISVFGLSPIIIVSFVFTSNKSNACLKIVSLGLP